MCPCPFAFVLVLSQEPQGEAKLANMSGVQRNTCDIYTALGRQQGEASAPGDGPVPLGAPPGAGMAGPGRDVATWRGLRASRLGPGLARLSGVSPKASGLRPSCEPSGIFSV